MEFLALLFIVGMIYAIAGGWGLIGVIVFGGVIWAAVKSD